jgi:hypothetical protein
MGILSFFKSKTKKNIISINGGPGDSKKSAVVIQAPDSIAGIMAEYEYLENRYGIRDVDWKLFMQSLITGNGRSYDLLTIELKDGSRKSFYFDVTGFLGKF